MTLILTRWPSYTNLTCSPWRYAACASMNFLHQGYRKLMYDRHHDHYCIPRSFVGGQKTMKRLYLRNYTSWSDGIDITMTVIPSLYSCSIHTALCLIERELLLIEVLHWGNRNFRPFLLLWPWPWTDDFHIRTRPVCMEVCRMCNYELSTSRLSKVIVWQTDRCTHRQTRPKLYTTPLRGWSKKSKINYTQNLP